MISVQSGSVESVRARYNCALFSHNDKTAHCYICQVGVSALESILNNAFSSFQSLRNYKGELDISTDS